MAYAILQMASLRGALRRTLHVWNDQALSLNEYR
jgi:hypothetical protein